MDEEGEVEEKKREVIEIIVEIKRERIIFVFTWNSELALALSMCHLLQFHYDQNGTYFLLLLWRFANNYNSVIVCEYMIRDLFVCTC